MSSSFATNTGIFFLTLISRLPFRIIYIFSDFLYFVLYYIIRYRKAVVLENLQNSFPEKSSAEIKKISRKFFHYLADLTIEIVKMAGMRNSDFRKRMNVENPELLYGFFLRGQSVVVLSMHYCNWEWSSSVSLFVKHKLLGVYKPLHNKNFDRFVNQNRANTGSEVVQNSKILRRLVEAEKNKQPVLIGLIADQTPPKFHKFWLNFMNQETMFYTGPAAISKRFNYPVFFQKMEKTGRGKYRTKFELICEKPAEMSEAEIMKIYIRKMEEVINRHPEFYMWSHRRWKHKRPGDIPLTL